MKKYKKIKTESNILDEMKCDLCKKTSKNYGWDKGLCEVDEIKIERRVGKQYPECGWGTIYEVDLCPSCFNKFLSWLEEQGGSFTEKEWDY